MVRLFITVGSRDNVGPGDLVGAIANQANIAGSEVGKVDIRESHSLVEVAAAVADTVIQRVNGTEIRGRRAVVRRDEERSKREPSERSGPPRGREGGRPPRDGDRGGPRGAGRDSRGEGRGGEGRDSRGPRRPPPGRSTRTGPREPGRDRE
jgi:ATP-dependent RNA helicase DeaD